jgi:DNA-binding winged helix-turn-helix (wHTH) protein/predicted ATPase
MTPSRSGDLPAVRIEIENEFAWCGGTRLSLMPRTFAVLRHLVEHAGRLVTKEMLLAAVWRDAVVSDAALTTCIRDLRRALGDAPGAPRYIETVHRRGFRFIGPVAVSASAPAAPAAVPAGTNAIGTRHAGAVAVVPPGRAAKAATSGRIAPDVSLAALPMVGRDDDAWPAAPSMAGRDAVVSPTTPTLVGRDAELARLHERLGAALNGERQLVFVTGEPGIGKTALVEAFLARIAPTETLRIGRGQCIEQYGTGETYLPLLEALGRLGRAPGGDEVVRVLKRHAPTWLVQLPSLLADQDLEAVQHRAQGATRERMLRELVEGLDTLTFESPLVLVLEDLHWSDSATIDLLAMLARRREPSRLLLLATYRPADVVATRHPLKAVKQELELHALCEEIALQFLPEVAVSEYLSRRFAQDEWPPELSRELHRRTDGNPLFLVNMIDDLVVQGQLREVDGHWKLAVPVAELAAHAPETLSEMIHKQVERLTADEQAMLAVGCVAGSEFSAAVGTAGGIGEQDAERRCDALARRGQFLRAIGVAEWPDGTVAGRYAFIHSLYQHVLYASLPVGRRAELHLRTGERLERGYGARAGEIAGELAAHFAQGRDFARAARYHGQAAEHAVRRHGYREAADHAARALELLAAWPDSPERTRHELALHVVLGGALTATHGYAAPDAVRAYARARELCARAGETPELFNILLGLVRVYTARGDLPAARDVAGHLERLADTASTAVLAVAGHNALGLLDLYAGDFARAIERLEHGIALHDRADGADLWTAALRIGPDPAVACTTNLALALWIIGRPDRAVATVDAARVLAASLDHPRSLAYANHYAAALHGFRREWRVVRERHDVAATLATEHGLAVYRSAGEVHRGRLLAEDGQVDAGLARMREAAAASWTLGLQVWAPVVAASMAEVYAGVHRPTDGLALVRDALDVAERSGWHYWTAELHRLEGVLTLQSDARGREEQAEACFREAIELARRQCAKSFELRAATSLARLWARQGKTRDAHALLAEVYAWFTEGFDMPDLTDARALLEQIT